jgi:16S rRNA (guanine966-N2)-methyltransferase
MRVVGGAAKGRRLRAPRGPAIRPTADHVRQAIFDIIGRTVKGARVLDLFAGTGAMGIEALSRGAVEAVFVEQSREACALILENLETTGLRAAGLIRRADVSRVLARPAQTPFGLVLIDPPYERGLGFVARILGKLAAGGWPAPGATVVVEAATGRVDWPEGYRETRVRSFGRTQVSVAVNENA